MTEISINGCKCVCDNVNITDAVAHTTLFTVLQVGLVVLVILLVILGLIIGFKKLQDAENKEKTQKNIDFQNHRRQS